MHQHALLRLGDKSCGRKIWVHAGTFSCILQESSSPHPAPSPKTWSGREQACSGTVWSLRREHWSSPTAQIPGHSSLLGTILNVHRAFAICLLWACGEKMPNSGIVHLLMQVCVSVSAPWFSVQWGDISPMCLYAYLHVGDTYVLLKEKWTQLLFAGFN